LGPNEENKDKARKQQYTKVIGKLNIKLY